MPIHPPVAEFGMRGGGGSTLDVLYEDAHMLVHVLHTKLGAMVRVALDCSMRALLECLYHRTRF